MISGCFTALITPFKEDAVDYDGLSRLVDFQIGNNVSGILGVGTTGESPTLSWDEHNKIVDIVADKTGGKCKSIAGTGSNNTKEALAATKHAVSVGADAVLLVDPYYNGPSSLEIRKEYIEPVASAFPDTQIIPYIIPGRTGAQLLPEDIAILSKKYSNIKTVKEATGSIENMKRTRQCCGSDFTILSGDDALTYPMMTDPEILATGVISVVSNIAPKAVVSMLSFLKEGKHDSAKTIMTGLEPLFDLVTVQTKEKTPFGEVVCRARNPLGIKTLMAILGMPSGGCRKPLGKMTRNGVEKIVKIAKKVQVNDSEIFKPLSEFFNINVDERLNNPQNIEGLYYKNY